MLYALLLFACTDKPLPDTGGIDPVDDEVDETVEPDDTAAPCETATWYADEDRDGYGDPDATAATLRRGRRLRGVEEHK